jgi:quercetin dioxygenase-like cupin family protein
MKTVLLIIAGTLIFAVAPKLVAQDWKKTNPEMNAILVDTTLVRAMAVTIEPGQKSDTHSHPAHFFYALTEGKLVVHYSDGKNETYDLKLGDAGFSAPEGPHVVENVGTKQVKFLLVELKEHPYKAPMEKK